MTRRAGTDGRGDARFFDRMARELLGISGDEYDAIADDGDHSDIMYLAMFLPRDRA